jgi:hypothetical protein
MATTIQILDSDIKSQVRKNDELKLKLAQSNNVKVDTVNRWLREDDVILTTATNLEIIREGLKLKKNAALTEPKELEAQN